jgi:ATP-dependent Clp protease ATP-binding subunit ClpX
LNTNVIGFKSGAENHSGSRDEVIHLVNHHDLKKFGIIPELLGRLPVLAYLEKLTKDYLIRILTEPKNALVSQYKKLFEIDGIEIEFTKDALEMISQQAIDNKLGARGLRSICEKVLTDPLFSGVKESRLVVDSEYLKTKLNLAEIPLSE